MLRYLKAAFLLPVRVPVFGWIPLNVVFLVSMLIIGERFRALWPIGAAIEIAYLMVLSTNRRFQNVVDAELRAADLADPARQRKRVLAAVSPEIRKRYEAVVSRCDRALSTAAAQGAEEFTLQSHRDALDRISLSYLRLLLAQETIRAASTTQGVAELRQQIQSLSDALAASEMSESVRRSKQATLDILVRRVELADRRATALEEIAAELTRVEAQVDLAVENASLSAKPTTIAGEIPFASSWLDPELLGTSPEMLRALGLSQIDADPARQAE